MNLPLCSEQKHLELVEKAQRGGADLDLVLAEYLAPEVPESHRVITEQEEPAPEEFLVAMEQVVRWMSPICNLLEHL